MGLAKQMMMEWVDIRRCAAIVEWMWGYGGELVMVAAGKCGQGVRREECGLDAFSVTRTQMSYRTAVLAIKGEAP